MASTRVVHGLATIMMYANDKDSFAIVTSDSEMPIFALGSVTYQTLAGALVYVRRIVDGARIANFGLRFTYITTSGTVGMLPLYTEGVIESTSETEKYVNVLYSEGYPREHITIEAI